MNILLFTIFAVLVSFAGGGRQSIIASNRLVGIELSEREATVRVGAGIALAWTAVCYVIAKEWLLIPASTAWIPWAIFLVWMYRTRTQPLWPAAPEESGNQFKS